MRTGLTDEVVAELVDYESSSLLADSWKAALRLTDHLSGEGAVGPIGAELHDDLRQYFDDREILMLGTLISVGTGWQRMIEAFEIRPDHYVPGQAGPWQRR